MANDNCNSVSNCGQGSCTDDDSYVKLKSTQPKIISKLTDIENTLDSFSSTLSAYCQLEQQNLTDINSKLTEVVNINSECCSIVNTKLQELLAVIADHEVCEKSAEITTTTVAPTTTEQITTTAQPTTTIAPTTTIESTTTATPTTTSTPTTTATPTTTVAPVPTYFFSATGNDANDGLTDNTPKQTITELNSLTLVPGDFVALKSGDTFEGTITLTDSGTSENPITIGSYGVGDKPIINSAPEITGWTLHSGSIYKKTLSTDIKQLFIDGSRAQLARYPKTYAEITTVNSTTEFESTDITSEATNYYQDAICIIKSSRYNIKAYTVSASSGQAITFGSEPTFALETTDGFFLVNKLEFLTEAGEWYYNSTTKELYAWMPNSDAPSNYTIKGSTIDNNVIIQSNYTTVKDLTLQYAADDAVLINGSYNNNIIDNVTILYPAITGVALTNSTFTEVKNSYCIGAMDSSIFASSGVDNAVILDNEFRYSGQLDSITLNTGFSTSPGQNLYFSNCDDVEIGYNKLYDSGYAAVKFNFGAYHIHHNFIDGACQVLDDGGALYTYTGGSYSLPSIVGSIVEYNIIRNTWGTVDGYFSSTKGYGFGVYLDNHSGGAIIRNNIIEKCVGGTMHNANQDIDIYDNIFYDNNVGHINNDVVSNFDYNNNTVVTTDRLGSTVHWTNSYQRINDVAGGFATYDYNTYIDTNGESALFYGYADFAAWKTASGGDANSTLDSTTFSAGVSSALLYNNTKTTKTFYLNSATSVTNLVTGAPITTDFTIAPFESVIVKGVDVSTISDTQVSELVEKAIVWYEFEETSGTSLVDATGNHNGTISAGVVINQTGANGQGHQFAAAADNYNVISDADDLTLGNSYAIAAWFSPTALNSGKNILVRKSNEYSIEINSSGNLYSYTYSSGGTAIFKREYVAAAISAGNDYCIVANVVDASTGDIEIWINGVLQSSTSADTGTWVGMTNTANGVVIGALNTTDPPIGVISQEVLFSSSLTIGAIAQYYNSGSGVTYASLTS